MNVLDIVRYMRMYPNYFSGVDNYGSCFHTGCGVGFTACEGDHTEECDALSDAYRYLDGLYNTNPELHEKIWDYFHDEVYS